MRTAALKLADDTKRKPPRRVNFTKASIEAIQPPAAGESVTWDAKQRGLCLRTRASGSKAFYVLAKDAGRLRRTRLGDFPLMTVEQARKGAVTELQRRMDGFDTNAKRKAKRQELTIGDLWKLYTDEHLTPRCSPRTKRQDVWLYDRYLVKLAPQRLGDVSRQQAREIHTAAAKASKVSANRAIQLLRRLYRYAAKHHNYTGDMPTIAVDLFKETSRERFLSPDELPRFLAAADAEGQPWADFFKLCIFIGARRSNVQAMKWENIDMKAGTLTIPAEQSKSRRAMTIPLASPALAILKQRKAEQEEAAAKAKPPAVPPAYVFPPLRDKGGTLHLSQPARPFDRICERAGITGLTIHDLRRTAGAWLAASGANLPTIGRMLGHADLRATQIYARLDLAPVRNAMETATAAMMKGGAK